MEDHEQEEKPLLPMKNISWHCLRHSTAHVMAQAIMKVYPEAKLAIGPAIKDGFYYDVDIDTTLSEDSLLLSKSK